MKDLVEWPGVARVDPFTARTSLAGERQQSDSVSSSLIDRLDTHHYSGTTGVRTAHSATEPDGAHMRARGCVRPCALVSEGFPTAPRPRRPPPDLLQCYRSYAA
ncbi:unnamed protein product [Colias eurytheme]|nr:unnamed protein product [Colias eurytheme]